jgi:hypothetical protein
VGRLLGSLSSDKVVAVGAPTYLDGLGQTVGFEEAETVTGVGSVRQDSPRSES